MRRHPEPEPSCHLLSLLGSPRATLRAPFEVAQSYNSTSAPQLSRSVRPRGALHTEFQETCDDRRKPATFHWARSVTKAGAITSVDTHRATRHRGIVRG